VGKKPSVLGLIYNSMKNLKTFKLYEGDWWDNDPSAPWNQPEDPEPVADIEYSEAKRDFVVLGTPGDDAILKKKSDNSLWVMDVTDIGDEHEDYLYYYVGGEDDDRERAEGYEEEEYASIATDLFKEFNFQEGKEAWVERDGERLFKIDQDLAESLIDEYVNYSRQRDRRHAPSTSNMEEYKKAASILSKAFPEA
jgi:hypothetical protein